MARSSAVYLSIFCLYVKVDPQISQVADFLVFGGGVVDSRFKTFRFFDSKRELFEKLASELKTKMVKNICTHKKSHWPDGDFFGKMLIFRQKNL